MSQKIVDLDAALGEPIRVKLKGTIYKLPPDLPVELWLALGETDDDTAGEDAAELTPAQKAEAMRVEVEDLYTMILDLFREHQPTLEKLPIGMGQLVTLIGNVYGQKPDQDAAEGKAPRTTARRGRQTSSRSRPPKSPS
jgi:hypothetical protein